MSLGYSSNVLSDESIRDEARMKLAWSTISIDASSSGGGGGTMGIPCMEA